jgi:hypothetical protein
MSKEELLLESWRKLSPEEQDKVLSYLNTLNAEVCDQFLQSSVSPLGQRLQQIRRRILASGVSLLDWDDLEKEIANRRGGVDPLGE